nr:DNA methyltransferase [Streptomyces cupreus]
MTGDASEVLRTLPAASVDCVVTSPPYWRMRDYATGRWNGGKADCLHAADAPAHPTPRVCARCGASWTDAQHGLEPTPTAYVEHLRQVFYELRRLLSPTGTLWLNLGDNYSTNSDGYRCAQPLRYRESEVDRYIESPPRAA